MESSLHDTIYGWLRTSYWNHLIPYDPVSLVEAVKSKAHGATAHSESSGDPVSAKNMSALAAWVLSEAALDYPESSSERTAIVAALGYLLANIRASHQTYLHPVVFPFGEFDLKLLDQAEGAYAALALITIRTTPNALDHVRPMLGTVHIHAGDESGIYEPAPNEPTIPHPPAPWKGKWAGYPLK